MIDNPRRIEEPFSWQLPDDLTRLAELLNYNVYTTTTKPFKAQVSDNVQFVVQRSEQYCKKISEHATNRTDMVIMLVTLFWLCRRQLTVVI